MSTPEKIKDQSDKYEKDSWRSYTTNELGNWVHNLLIRSSNRTEKHKARKDLKDARNYLAMMREQINEQEEFINDKFKNE